MNRLYLLLKNSTAPVTLTAKGQSMLPFIQPNDRLVIESCLPGAIRPGDIVAIYRGGDLVCHRILAHWRRNGFHLFFEKGDNQTYGKFFLSKNLIGKVIAINDRPLLITAARLSAGNLTKLIWRSLWAWFRQTCQEHRQAFVHD